MAGKKPCRRDGAVVWRGEGHGGATERRVLPALHLRVGIGAMLAVKVRGPRVDHWPGNLPQADCDEGDFSAKNLVGIDMLIVEGLGIKVWEDDRLVLWNEVQVRIENLSTGLVQLLDLVELPPRDLLLEGGSPLRGPLLAEDDAELVEHALLLLGLFAERRTRAVEAATGHLHAGMLRAPNIPRNDPRGRGRGRTIPPLAPQAVAQHSSGRMQAARHSASRQPPAT